MVGYLTPQVSTLNAASDTEMDCADAVFLDMRIVHENSWSRKNTSLSVLGEALLQVHSVCEAVCLTRTVCRRPIDEEHACNS